MRKKCEKFWLFVSKRNQIAMMADGKLCLRISHRLFETSRPEMRIRMAKKVAIGIQDFDKLFLENYFYVDKTYFIKEWWEYGDDVTLIARPRRFGKTLTMSMLEHFFSIRYVEDRQIFKGLAIWRDEKYQKLQGTYPVINISFANVKEKNFEMAVYQVCQILQGLYRENYFLLESSALTEGEKRELKRGADDGIAEKDAPMALHKLSAWLYRHYEKKVIILLDEYDTPMQEAYVNGYWRKMRARCGAFCWPAAI